MAFSNLSAKTTHELWVEARTFLVNVSRPTPSSLLINILYPSDISVADGAVVLLHTAPLKSEEFPTDGTRYTPSTNLSAVADTTGPKASGPVVVGMYSKFNGAPLPMNQMDSTTGMFSTFIEITNASPDVLYFVTVHACTNILQYYPLGISSYLHEEGGANGSVASYAGNIPSLSAPPLSPKTGYVYHDTTNQLIQYWTGDSWVPTSADTLKTGEVYPASVGQIYFLNGYSGYGFDGSDWVSITPETLKFKIGGTWVSFTKFAGVLSKPAVSAPGDLIWDHTLGYALFSDGATWNVPNITNSLLVSQKGASPAFTVPPSIESVPLGAPVLGQLFYNTKNKQLDVWTGSRWIMANTAQVGVTSTEKMSVGTDGSYDERIRLTNILKAQLGWPQSCLELKEEQFDVAIDNALDNYRMWSDGAYTMKYFMFKVLKGQQTYFLNSPIDKTDRIVGVTKIHRLNALGLQANSGESIWTSGILASYYSASTVDLLSISLLNNMSDEFERIFAGNLTFLWDEPSRELFITRRISTDEKIIIEATCEKTEQEIMVDRWSKQFIQNWALAEAKYMLGMVRTRFSSGTPGANGSITQNGDLLISEANQEMLELKEACLSNYEFGGHIGGGNQSFLIG